MIYRAPERTTPARGRAVTQELAALLVAMAVVAALILQFACAGTGPGGTTGRWLCVNNARLAALHGPTPTPTGTPQPGRAVGIRPIAGATASAPGAPVLLEAPTMAAFLEDAFAAMPTSTDSAAGAGYPPWGGQPNRMLPTPYVALPNEFDNRRATRTALAAEGLAAATARALADESAATATPTETPFVTAGSATPTPTPGPGTPSVTPGPTPTGTAAPTETGYP